MAKLMRKTKRESRDHERERAKRRLARGDARPRPHSARSTVFQAMSGATRSGVAAAASASASGRRVVVSFSGCGFLAPFHLGSLSAFRRAGVSVDRALGASSGSLVAAAAVLGVPEDVQRERFYRIVRHAAQLRPIGAFHPGFDFGKLFMEHFSPSVPEDAHERCSRGRLTVSITRTDMSNELVTDFHSREDLMDCLICSCFLPGFSGYSAPSYKGKVAEKSLFLQI